jgi:hypothetical protein
MSENNHSRNHYPDTLQTSIYPLTLSKIFMNKLQICVSRPGFFEPPGVALIYPYATSLNPPTLRYYTNKKAQ